MTEEVETGPLADCSRRIPTNSGEFQREIRGKGNECGNGNGLPLMTSDDTPNKTTQGQGELVERLLSIDVVEAYSLPRITVEAKKFGLKAGEAWDLTNGWDSRRQDHREAAEKYQRDMKTLVFVG